MVVCDGESANQPVAQAAARLLVCKRMRVGWIELSRTVCSDWDHGKKHTYTRKRRANRLVGLALHTPRHAAKPQTSRAGWVTG